MLVDAIADIALDTLVEAVLILFQRHLCLEAPVVAKYGLREHASLTAAAIDGQHAGSAEARISLAVEARDTAFGTIENIG